MAEDHEVTLSTTEVSGRGDVKTMDIKRTYTPPLDGTVDELKRFDVWIATRVAEILVKNFHGYAWYVMADSKQGIVCFSIPDLMGPTLKWVIRLGEYADLQPALIYRSGGELLERMGLRRGPMDIAEYEAAKHKMHTFDFSDVKQ